MKVNTKTIEEMKEQRNNTIILIASGTDTLKNTLLPQKHDTFRKI